jgi:hypothetical protein
MEKMFDIARGWSSQNPLVVYLGESQEELSTFLKWNV